MRGQSFKSLLPFILACEGLENSSYQEDELEEYLKENGHTITEECNLIRQKKSCLSKRLRNIALYREKLHSKKGEL